MESKIKTLFDGLNEQQVAINQFRDEYDVASPVELAIEAASMRLAEATMWMGQARALEKKLHDSP